MAPKAGGDKERRGGGGHVYVLVSIASLVVGGILQSQLGGLLQGSHRAPEASPEPEPVARTVAVERVVERTVAAAAGPVAKTVGRPVVMIIADDLRPQFAHLGYDIKTPNIDRLASGGFEFERAYCNAPSCNPSRNSFLTGVMPDVSKVYAFEATVTENMGEATTTIFNKMRSHGYLAMGVGKIFHWAPVGDSFSFMVRPGQKVGKYFPNDYDQEWGCQPNEPSGTCTPKLCTDANTRGACAMGKVYVSDVPVEQLFDYRVASEADRLLRIAADEWRPDRHGVKRPSFVGVGFHHPHTKWVVPRALWEATQSDIRVQPAMFHEPPQGAPYWAAGDINVDGDIHLIDGTRVPSRDYYAAVPARGIKRMPSHAQEELRRGYFACITFMDSQLGRVLDTMDQTGLANDSVVLFFSDHGYGVGEGGHWGKSALYEIDTRVPLIIRDPHASQSRGKSTKAVVELTDLWKTIVDLSGLPFENDGHDYYGRRHGKSLRKFLREPDLTNHRWGKEIAVTVMPKCYHPGSSRESVPFMCRGKSHDWASKGDVPRVGFGVRSTNHRYVAWMAYNGTLDNVDWSRAPAAEELYDHDPEDASKRTFDSWDRVNLLASDAAAGKPARKVANTLLAALRDVSRKRIAAQFGSYPWHRHDETVLRRQKAYSNIGWKNDEIPK
ncbi:alkaline-phosphatase-like protein [Pelagophyceae sp. CCMP2097]|nr:alkaline-phosphatase-like protein [Pelagophyceae sp. CCMP2097]